MIESIDPAIRTDAEEQAAESAAWAGAPDSLPAEDSFRIGRLRFRRNPLSGLTIGLSLIAWAVIIGLVLLLW